MNGVIADFLQTNVQQIKDILQVAHIDIVGTASDKTELYIILKNAEVDFLVITDIFLEQANNYRVMEEIQFYFPGIRVVKYYFGDDKELVLKQLEIGHKVNNPPIPFN